MKEQIEEMMRDIDAIYSTDFKGDYESGLMDIAERLYNAGYRKQEWISVEDRLPDNGLERVLVFLRDDDFTKPIGENKIDTDRYLDGKWVRWGRFVTHWMPLPEPPKMKGGAG